MNRKQDLYKVPIVSSWGAVTFVNHEVLIDPLHRACTIALDKDNLPIKPEDITPLNIKAVIVVTRRTGDPTPTEQEKQFCEAWRKALEETPAVLADYIIICGASHYSFASEKVEGPGRMGF